jgi:hydroxyacylglutathione hydrolase
MILKQFVLGALENNNYLLIDDQSKQAALIDCTEFCEDIAKVLKEYDAELKYILLTHGHFDHILGVNDFKKKYNCRVLLHKDDKFLADTVKEFVKKFDIDDVEIQEIDEYIDDTQVLKLGRKKINIIHTPGHTKGGVCYLIRDKLFSGDTLFYESVGRTDLAGGDFDELKSSIENKLFTLDENIKVYPGHGISSSIGHEKENNKFL